MSAAPQTEVLLEHLFRHQAEDTVQEAMLRALQTWPYQGMPENASAWLFRVAHNAAIDGRVNAIEAGVTPIELISKDTSLSGDSEASFNKEM